MTYSRHPSFWGRFISFQGIELAYSKPRWRCLEEVMLITYSVGRNEKRKKNAEGILLFRKTEEMKLLDRTFTKVHFPVVVSLLNWREKRSQTLIFFILSFFSLSFFCISSRIILSFFLSFFLFTYLYLPSFFFKFVFLHYLFSSVSFLLSFFLSFFKFIFLYYLFSFFFILLFSSFFLSILSFFT